MWAGNTPATLHTTWAHCLDYGKVSSNDPGNSWGQTLRAWGKSLDCPLSRALANVHSSSSVLSELEGLGRHGRRYPF